ncbi:PaaI family thioesterase [Hyphococcus sp.]|uniref:PaaI family thioesterase n=1 Tax=Hyphococcus sp. TaxID=2038636 RepID=UPI003CCBB7FE
MSENEKFEAPPGWRLSTFKDTFGGHAGPFYFREEGPTPGVGFFSRSIHANLGGVIHGGMLMTLADMSLFDICFRKAGSFRGVTVTMNAEFLRPGPCGCFIEATGETTAIGKRMLFARGLVTAEGKALLSFSGSLKRID